MHINLKQLRAFREVYYAGHLSAAADKLSLTSSAISVLIAQFEKEGGVKLFDRTPRGLIPTAAAHKAVQTAERILADVDMLDRQFKESARSHVDTLSFAVTQAVASMLMPSLISDFAREHPEVHVTMHDCAPDQLAEIVISGAVDFGMGSFDNSTSALTAEVIMNDSISAIFPKTSPLAERRQVRWEELEGLQVIVPRHNGAGGVRTLIETTLAQAGRKLEPAYEATSMNTALGMAAHGFGVAVYPPLLMPYFDFPQLAARRLVEPTVERHMAIIRRPAHALTPVAERFVGAIRSRLLECAVAEAG